MRCRLFSILGFVAMAASLFGCVPHKGAEEFLPPEIVSSRALVQGSSVSLECTLSDSRVESCGFVYGVVGGEKTQVTCELTSVSFAAMIGSLAPGSTYEWYAFARAGSEEIRSGPQFFTTEEIPEVPQVGREGIEIPDPYFRRYILENFDSDGDGVLSEEEGLSIRKIDVVTDKISSMRGIEHFKNLDSLLCRGANVYEYDNIGHPGMLDSLDVSANCKLRYLACDRNMIRSLNISDNPFLEEVLCSYNLLESIDLSAVPRLRELRMWANDVSSLDFSRTPLLETLECGNNQITSLDMRPCQRLTVLECSPMNGTSGKNLLQKLYVSEEQAIPGVTLDRSKKNVPEETEIVLVKAGTVIIPDPAFKAWLVSSFDMDSDGELSFEEAADIHEIDIWSDELGVTSLKGIEHMPSLEVLSCQGSWVGTSVLNREHYYLSKHYHFDSVGPIGTLKDVDVSGNPKLRVLNLRNNSGIGETGDGSINLSGCPELEELDLGYSYIKYPDISVCPLLREVNLSHGRGDMPDFSKLTNLRSLEVAHHQSGRHQAVDVSACHALEELNVDASASSLSNLSNNPRLKILKVSWCPEIHPDLTVLPLLEEYERISCEEKSLDLPGLKNLKSLNVSENPIGSLDLTGFPSLERLVCSSCGLSSLDVSSNLALKELYCSPMDGPDGKNLLESLIISKDQIIPGVTVDRDTDHVPSGTKVVRR